MLNEAENALSDFAYAAEEIMSGGGCDDSKELLRERIEEFLRGVE